VPLAEPIAVLPNESSDSWAETSDGQVWIVFADLIAYRVFFECGIVDKLRAAFPGRVAAVFLVDDKHVTPWLERLAGIQVLRRDDVMPADVGPRERVERRLDRALDHRIGFYPLAVRHSLRHGFHEGRWDPAHPSPFFHIRRAGWLPRWRFLDWSMARWHLSRRRYVPSTLLERMRAECTCLVITNPQAHLSMPLLTAARRLALPTIGYVASWDHPVGKGLVSPHLSRYIVQNEVMRDDLRVYHGVDPARVSVTGWPQTDVYAKRQPRDRYRALLRTLGLDDDRPVVLFAGNMPSNAPYEGNLVRRLVAWWQESGGHERFSLLFRPHPYDRQVAERFAAALDAPRAAVQMPTPGDFTELATLLQHADCVIANAGTILLEALVNDRPSICVTFDEGAPRGRSWADLNLTGRHYRELLASDAFYRADDFEQLVGALARALQHPSELGSERRRVSQKVVGEVDGHAADRVVSAIEETLGARHARSARGFRSSDQLVHRIGK
jgi:UDP-N-acetylglucosamine:LPS N-acetylglucosamine transferase